jgi:hypothetical protein
MGHKQIDGIGEQGVKENIWTYESGSVRRIETSAE